MELKSTIAEIKNSLEGPDDRFAQAEERIRKPENKTMGITESEEQKVKRLKKNKQSLWIL